MLVNPINGRVLVQGDEAYFVCSSGTAVVGEPILTCINGTWNNPPPTCKLLNPQNSAGYSMQFAIAY